MFNLLIITFIFKQILFYYRYYSNNNYYFIPLETLQLLFEIFFSNGEIANHCHSSEKWKAVIRQ